MSNIYQLLYSHSQQVRQQQPLIVNLSNSVTPDFMANVLLAVGAAPIMSEHAGELAELIAMAHGVNINIGTLSPEFSDRALTAAKLTRQQNKCLVLDPVGAGATAIRTQLAKELFPFATIIRGNASEISALTTGGEGSYGVETTIESTAAVAAASQLAIKTGKIIAISGAHDYVCSPQQSYHSNFGVELMTKVTGMGCCLSALIAAFASTAKDQALASHLAIIYYNLCAEQAYIHTKSPASFKIKFIDCLYQPDWAQIGQRLLIQNSYLQANDKIHYCGENHEE